MVNKHYASKFFLVIGLGLFLLLLLDIFNFFNIGNGQLFKKGINIPLFLSVGCLSAFFLIERKINMTFMIGIFVIAVLFLLFILFFVLGLFGVLTG